MIHRQNYFSWLTIPKSSRCSVRASASWSLFTRLDTDRVSTKQYYSGSTDHEIEGGVRRSHATSISGSLEMEMSSARDQTDAELTVRLFYFLQPIPALINKIMFSISSGCLQSQNLMAAQQKGVWGKIKDMSRLLQSSSRGGILCHKGIALCTIQVRNRINSKTLLRV